VGLNFMTYELVRKYLTPEGDKNPSAVRKLAAGAISGAVAQTCTYPLYVIIVCLQLPNDVDRI
jgi:solute carrier family 25 phosphate transporter 23/24/25/41